MKPESNSSYGRVGNTYKSPALGDLIVKSLTLTPSDIKTWKTAVDSARSATSPRRSNLYDLYNNIILDAHLASVMKKRTVAITNKKIMWVPDNQDTKNADQVKKEIIERPWFYDLLLYMMEAISWGHSLVEIIPQNGNQVKGVELIDRYLVMPEYGFASKTYSNVQPSPQSGVFYRDNPLFEDLLIEIGKPKDYGLLMVACPYVIYKRNGIGDWAQFAEIFGMPFRVGKYNPFDDRTRKLLEDGLDAMGGASHAVIPDGTSIEFHDNNSSGKSEVFKDLVSIANEEISKLYLGGTMTIEDGASRAQGEVHSEGEDDINLSDMIWVEHLLNFVVRPKLFNLTGIKALSGGMFRFPETGQIPLEKRITIDMQLSQRIPMPEGYWYKTYGIDKPEGATLLPIANDPYTVKEDPDPDGDIDEPEKEEETDPPKKQPVHLAAKLNAIYSSTIRGAKGFTITAAEKKKRDEIWDHVTKGIYEGKIKPGKVDPELHQWIVDRLFKGVTTGFGGDFKKFTADSPDYEMLAKLEKDVQVFSGFKAHQELRAATDLLTDENGIVRSFNEFKQLMQAIDETYNVVWLSAEYNQAIASSQMASKWVDYTRNSDVLPLLKYTTAGDDRVRVDHAQLDGIVKPVDDEFWDSYYPPNDWGCRCDVDQLSEGTVTETDPDKLPVLKDMFAINSAKQGVVFPPKHPYYEVQQRYRRAADKNFGLDI